MNNFAILNLTYFPTPTALLFYCETNNPCHLTCYYTDKKPGRHKTSRVERGINLPWGAYFCFVAWQSVEQIEVGDTLIHTFPFPTWVFCQTKWYVFRGTIATILSPSVSPIFEYHHPGQAYFCNLGFEFYPITPGAPPCWVDDSTTPDPNRIVRDTTYVKEGQYSCKLIGVTWMGVTRLRQDRPAAVYAGKTLKFTFNYRAWVDCYYRIEIKVTGEHSWTWTSAGGTVPRWVTRTFTHAIDPNAEEIQISFSTYHFAGGSSAISWDAFSIEEV